MGIVWLTQVQICSHPRLCLIRVLGRFRNILESDVSIYFFNTVPTVTGYLRLACCCDLPSNVYTVIEASRCPSNLSKIISQSGTTRCSKDVTGSARSPFGVQRWGLCKNPEWFTLHIIEASDLSHVPVIKGIEGIEGIDSDWCRLHLTSSDWQFKQDLNVLEADSLKSPVNSYA
jgi:hypothetical protein